jgi:predicted RecB family nuclease
MRQLDDRSYIFSPTDLVAFLGCYHATILDLKESPEHLARDEVTEGDQLLRQKGLEHEAAYLQLLKTQGKSVAEIPATLPVAERVQQTSQALKSGVDVVYQAAFLNGCWGGYADFLIKTQQPSDLGDFSYEVADTKLARHADPKYLVQLCVYSDLLMKMQGRSPTYVHLFLGYGQQVSFLAVDFAAYVGRASRRVSALAAEGSRSSAWRTTSSAGWWTSTMCPTTTMPNCSTTWPPRR